MEKLKKILASILCLNILLSGSPVLLFAAEPSAPSQSVITGYDRPESGVYNISPETVSSNTGIRNYTEFTLAQGDTANLIFSPEYNKFLNFVVDTNKTSSDTLVNIWGTVNTTDANGKLTNGNALFITNGGIIIGSSGVVNAGSVSLISSTPDAINAYKEDQKDDNYNKLISSSTGDVYVAGKITASDTVVISGNDIEVKDTQIITGKEVFDSLVNNNAQNATNVTVRNGKVILSAKSNYTVTDQEPTQSIDELNTSISITNSTIESGDVTIEAENILTVKGNIDTEDPLDKKSAGSVIDLKDSSISGSNVTVSAKGTYEFDVKEVKGMKFKIDASDFKAAYKQANIDGVFDLENVAKQFLKDVSDRVKNSLKNYYGSASEAKVTIANTTVTASGDIKLQTNAVAKNTIGSLKMGAIGGDGKKSEAALISIGSKTESIVLVDGSNLKAEGNLEAKAVSNNGLSVKIEDEKKTQYQYAFPFVSTSTDADTEVVIQSNSKLTGKQTDISTYSYESHSLDVSATATVGTDGTDTDLKKYSGALVTLFEYVDVKNEVDIVDSTVESTGGDLSIQALGAGKNTMKGTAKTVKAKDKKDAKQGENPKEGDKTIFKVGGSFVFADTDTKVNVNISKSTIKSAAKLQIRSYLYNNTTNTSITNGKKGETDGFGAGIALIISDVDNDSNVTIKDSTLDAKGSMNIDAVTELPGNKGTIKLGTEQINFTFDFETGAEDRFDKKAHIKFDIKSFFKKPTKIDFKPEFSFKGFFNNIAGAYVELKGGAAVEASVVADKVSNNTNVVITNSKLTSETGDIIANAVNSMNYADGVGFSRPKTGITKLGEIWNVEDEGVPGAGAGVLVQSFNNTSTVKVDSASELSAENGNVELNAASEQLYIDMAKLAAKAKDLDLVGATNVQLVGGVVAVEVSNAKIDAKDVQISAGKAKAQLSSKNESWEDNVNSSGVQFADSRDVNDHVTSVDFTGAYADAQEGGKSFEVGLGAAVNVKKVARTVKAVVDSSTIVASSGNVDVEAVSKTYMIELVMAGAFKTAATEGDKSGAKANSNVGDIGDGDKDGWQVVAEEEADSPAAKPAADNPVEKDVEEAVDGEGDKDDGQDPAPTPFTEDPAPPADQDNAAPAANEAAKSSNRTNWSLNIAGSVGVFVDKNEITASVKNSTLTASNGEINVSSDYNTVAILLAGGVSDSSTVGIGAGVNLYNRKGVTSALVEKSNLTSTKNAVKANEDSMTVNIVAGIVKGTDDGDGTFNFDLGGSFAYNTYTPVIKAEVTSGSVLKGTTDIDANGKLLNVDFAGGMEFKKGQGGASFQASSSFAGSADYLEADIVARVDSSTISDASVVSVDAKDDVQIVDISAAVGANATSSKTQTALEGSLTIVSEKNKISALINDSNVSASGDINVTALNATDVFNLDGVIDYSKTDSGIGANGAVNINIHKNTIKAEVTNTDSNKKVTSGGKLSIVADSQEKLNIINAAAVIGKETLLSASVVSVGIVKNTVSATGSGKLEGKTGVDVIAEDNAFILSRGGTLAGIMGGKNVGLAVSVNIDKMYKDVSATLKDATVSSDGDVNVKAISVDGMGASKDSDLSNLDEILKDAESEKPKGDGLNRDFDEWDMFYNLAGSGSQETFLTLSGAFALKIVKNNILATVDNSTVVSNNMTVAADQSSSKNLIAGSLSASMGRAAVGGQWIRPTDSSTVAATVKNNTKVTVDEKGKLNVTATENKNDKTILVAGAVASNVGVSANGLFNLNKSKLTALMTDSTLQTGSLNINSEEKINGLRVIVSAGGAYQGESLALNVALNTYKQIVEALVINSTIANSVSNFDLNAKNTIKTGDYLLGLGFTLQGASEGVVGIKNDYTNKTTASVRNSVLNNTLGINVKSVSKMDTDNRSLVAVGGFQGASIGANIIVNDDDSDTVAEIKDTSIDNTGNVVITVNEDENGKAVRDSIDNMVFAFGFEFQGAQVAANIVLNHYHNSAKALFDLNTAADKSAVTNNLTIRANSDRDIDTVSVMVGGNFMGAALNVNLVKNEVESTTQAAILQASDRNLTVRKNIEVKSNDSSLVANKLGTVGVGAASGVPIANVNLHYDNALSLAEITGGNVNAEDVTVSQDLVFGYKQTAVGVSIGGITMAGDVSVLRFGSDVDYTELERRAKIEDTVNQSKDIIEKAQISDSSESKPESGSQARVNANIKSDGVVNVTSNVTYKGYDEDTLKLTNVNVDVGGTGAGVGVMSFRQNSENTAKVSGTVNAKAVNVKATYKDSVDIDAVKVDIDLLKISGGSSSYNNTSKTLAIIKDANVTTSADVNVESRLDSKASTSATDVSMRIGEIAVAGYEVVGSSKTQSYVDSSAVKADNLNIKSTGSSDYSGTLKVVSISGISIGFTSTIAKNDVSFSSQIITDTENGKVNINVQNLNMLTGYDKLSVFTKNNAVKISGFDIISNDAKANLSARFYSGIGKAGADGFARGTINVSGTTTVETAKKLGNDNMRSAARIYGVSISLASVNVGTTARAENNVWSRTYFNLSSESSNGFTTGNLKVNANLDAFTDAQAEDSSGSLVGVKSMSVETESKSELYVLFAGNNTIKGEANLTADHKNEVKTDLSTFSAGLLANVDLSDLDSVMSATTKASIGGNLNYGKFNADFRTQRLSTLNLSTSGGGAVHVGSPSAMNSVTGVSEIRIENATANNSSTGDFNLTNYSDTTLDSVSHSSSGGFIAVQNAGKNQTLDTSATVVVDKANIGAQGKSAGSFSIDIKNTELVKDSSSNKGGGFVLVSSDSTENTYTSKAALTVNESNIYVDGFSLSTSTDISTDTNDYVKYKSYAGGLVPVTGVYIKNTLNQENTVNVTNSHIEATGLGTVTVAPSFQFQQDAGSDADGLSAWPTAEARLTSNNTNTVNVDKTSHVQAQILEFKLDANGTLRSYAHVKARDAYSEPESYSSVDMNLINNMKVAGKLKSTMFLDIEFMSASKIDVTQEAFTQHNAVAPSVDVDGHATKNISNTLVVNNDSGIQPGQPGRASLETERDMNISFSGGSGSVYSENHWKKVYYILFGKKKKGSDKSNSHNNYTPRFELNGDIIAGKSEEKYLYINSDGTVDEQKSFGFTDGEYTVVEDQDYTGHELKQQRLKYLEDSLSTVNNEITLLASRMKEIDEEQKQISKANNSFQEYSNKFNEAQASGEIVLDSFQNVLANTKNDIKSIVGQYYDDQVMTSILDQFDGFEDLNEDKIKEIINNMESLSQAEKTAYINGFVKASENVVQDWEFDTGYKDLNFAMYGYKVNGVVTLGLSPNGSGGYEEIDEMHDTLNRINDISKRLSDERADAVDVKTENERVRTILQAELVESRLKTEEQYALEYNPYAYVFQDMYLYGASHVNIDGLPAYSKSKYPDPDDVAIEGERKLQFIIKKPGGVKIENYSDYSLVFGSIDLTDKDGEKAVNAVIEKFKEIDLSKLREVESLTSALVINGEDKQYLIPDSTKPKIVGVTIMNYRNEANPYYEGPADHSVDYTGNITIKGNLTSDDKPVTIFAQSGNIIINGLNYVEGRVTDINAPQGVIQIGGIKEPEQNDIIVLKLGSSEKITAGKGITFIGDFFLLDSTITSGVTTHKFLLPSEISKDNLEFDPTTGKNDLIPKIEGSTVDAIFVSEDDGRNEKIYLFDIVNYQGYVRFKQPYRTEYMAPIRITGHAIINVNHGFGDIDISEMSGELINPYPLILGDIVNTSDTYENVEVLSSFNPSMPIQISNIFLNGNLVTEGGQFLTSLVVNTENDGFASTVIKTIGRGINIENNIYNGMFVDSTGYFKDDISDDKNLHNFIAEDDKSMINVNAVIEGSGIGVLNTAKRSDLNITKKGSVDFPTAMVWDVATYNDPIEARNITSNTMAFITLADYIDVENISVRDTATFNSSMRSKVITVNNLSIRREAKAPAKIYTKEFGAFDLSVDDTHIAWTNAPVVYTFGNVLIENPLGYHTFETIALSKAAEMTEETYTKSRIPFGGVYNEVKILDEEVELITEVNENSYSYLRNFKK